MTAVDFPLGRQMGTATLLVTVLTLALMTLAAMAPISSAITLTGTVTAGDGAHEIAHADGGRIEIVHVARGKKVAAGDRLITLDRTIIKAERLTIQSALSAAHGRQSRLRAEAADAPVPNGLDHGEAALMLARAARFAAAVAALDHEEIALKQESHLIAVEEDALNRERALVAAERARQAKLTRQGLSPENARLAADLTEARLERQAAELAQRRARAAARINEITARRYALCTERAEEIAKALQATITEITTLKARITALDRIEATLTLRAPVAGIVDGLTARPGTLAPPGAALMRIVPTQAITVEADLPAARIGAVAQGVPLRLIANGADGTQQQINGHLTYLAADATPPDPGSRAPPVFKLIATPDAAFNLTPGSEVAVQIETGRATALSLILQPIRVALHNAAP